MISFDELRDLPETKRLKQGIIVAAVIWLAALCVFSSALSALRANSDRLDDAERVLNAAVIVRGYPDRSAKSTGEPLSALSDALEKCKLKDRVAQLSSSQGGLVLQVNRLHTEELVEFVAEIQRRGLSVNSAEIRAINSQRDGRLINANMTIEGGER